MLKMQPHVARRHSDAGSYTARGLLTAMLLASLTPRPGVGLSAQETPFNTFERPSRFSPNWPRNYLFEGDPQASLYLWSDTKPIRALKYLDTGVRHSKCAKLDRISIPVGRPAATGCTFVVVPHFVIRQQSDSSAAVKPPSFNPYFEWTSYRMSKPTPLGWMTYTRLKLAHYSNGQAGCTYVGDTLQGKDVPCGRPPTVASDVPNTVNGDFSTSYAEPGLGVGVFGLNEGQMGWYAILDLSRIYHATDANRGSWVPGAMTTVQLRTYGKRESTAEVRGMYWIRPAATAIQATYLYNSADRAPSFLSWRSDASVGLTFQALFGVGFFARRSWGYDYYNIGYGNAVDNRTRLSIQFDPAMGWRRVKFNGSLPP